MAGRTLRVSMLSAALIAVVGAATGCGDDGSGALPTRSTIAVTSTAYVTIPARTTTSTVAPAAEDQGVEGDEGDGATNSEIADDPTRERVYEIQAGDYLVAIANDFDVPVNYLPEYNGWDDGLRHALVPGEEMRIPPSDWDPNGPAAPGSSADDSVADDTSAAVDCPNGEQQQTYTIKRGDIPATVAEEHGVTVTELNAANANTPRYRGFVVGIEIVIPC